MYGSTCKRDPSGRTGTCAMTILLALLALARPAATGEAGREGTAGILETIDSFRVASRQYLVSLRLTSYRGDEVRETALFDVYVGGMDKSLIVAREYRTRGMKILYSGSNMWVHLPNTRRPIRITPIQRLMGEASNGDVAEVSFAGSYRAAPAGKDTVSGVPCRILELTAKHKAATYSRILLWVRSEDCRPVKANYYLVSGKHFKTAFFEEYRKLAGRVALSRMTIHDEVRKGRRTIFDYLEITEREFPAKYFNKNYLIHVKGM